RGPRGRRVHGHAGVLRLPDRRRRGGRAAAPRRVRRAAPPAPAPLRALRARRRALVARELAPLPRNRGAGRRRRHGDRPNRRPLPLRCSPSGLRRRRRGRRRPPGEVGGTFSGADGVKRTKGAAMTRLVPLSLLALVLVLVPAAVA